MSARLRILTASRTQILGLQDRVRERIRDAASIEAASQWCVEHVAEAFGDAVLVRMFITIPYGSLPERERQAADGVAEAKGNRELLGDRTPVLTLVGTAGVEAAWGDRLRSQGHLGIPLCSAEFVDSIPMIAQLLREMGIDIGEDDLALRHQSEKVLSAGWVGLFHVDDARTSKDGKGRFVIPNQDFVDRYGIRCAFGLGKAFGNGSVACLIVFANSLITRDQVSALVPIMNMFKASTTELMRENLIFKVIKPPSRSGRLISR